MPVWNDRHRPTVGSGAHQWNMLPPYQWITVCTLRQWGIDIALQIYSGSSICFPAVNNFTVYLSILLGGYYSVVGFQPVHTHSDTATCIRLYTTSYSLAGLGLHYMPMRHSEQAVRETGLCRYVTCTLLCSRRHDCPPARLTSQCTAPAKLALAPGKCASQSWSIFLLRHTLLYPPLEPGALSDDARLTSVCLSRISGISREQRGLGRLKLAEVAHVTRDLDTTFKVKRSKVNLQGDILCGLPHSLFYTRDVFEDSIFEAKARGLQGQGRGQWYLWWKCMGCSCTKGVESTG